MRFHGGSRGFTAVETVAALAFICAGTAVLSLVKTENKSADVNLSAKAMKSADAMKTLDAVLAEMKDAQSAGVNAEGNAFAFHVPKRDARGALIGDENNRIIYADAQALKFVRSAVADDQLSEAELNVDLNRDGDLLDVFQAGTLQVGGRDVGGRIWVESSAPAFSMEKNSASELFGGPMLRVSLRYLDASNGAFRMQKLEGALPVNAK